MKQIILLGLLLNILPTSTDSRSFSGKIIYANTFTDLNGNDLTQKFTPFFGSENSYFINDSNYKAYNENNRLLYLYNSSTNTYYSCDRKNDIAKAIDGGTITSKVITTTKLNDKENICGFDCSSIKMTTESGSTVFYYTALISVDKNNYSRHNYGEWNSYLNATGGAIPLKTIYSDKKNRFIWTILAKEIVNIPLTSKDFEMPNNILLKGTVSPPKYKF